MDVPRVSNDLALPLCVRVHVLVGVCHVCSALLSTVLVKVSISSFWQPAGYVNLRETYLPS